MHSNQFNFKKTYSSSSQFKILNPYKLRYFKQTKIREED